MISRGILAAGLVLATTLAHSVYSSDARGQSPASIDASTVVHYRVTLAGHDSLWAVAPTAVSMQAGVSSDPSPTISIRSIQFAPPFLSCTASVGAGSIPVGLSGLTVDAAPQVIVLPTIASPEGTASFSAAGITTSARGTANYSLEPGLACGGLLNAGAPCSGPFDLSLVPAGVSGSITSGSIATTGSSRPFSLTFLGSYPFVTSGTWGRLDVRAEIVGRVDTAAPSCAADFDHSGSLAVLDIFAFLNAWFAGEPAADFNHVGGLSVQDIFDFLNGWFSGCP